ncbi:MAG TPA: hypothetical protein VGX50_16330 [Longimicrobium sp.]|jgi:hypothetical protein|nr:hypothetical protein [Longimicrobium sp.]
MHEDPIVAEVRKVRQELFAEFNYDLDAYVADLKARQQEREARTGVYMPHLASEAGPRKADAA